MIYLFFLAEEETPTNLTVFGRPILLALEEVDGSPSFLEKALRFVEDHGTSFMLSFTFEFSAFFLTHIELQLKKEQICLCRSQDRRNLETSC